MKLLKIAASGLMLLVASATASAAPYTDAEFDSLNQQGKPVLVEVHADWCPTCQRQKPVVDKLVSTKPYDAYTVLVVDFDRQGQAKKRFKVAQQSTLVVFNGGTERARATGVTSPADVTALLDKGLN